jgi:23S rRNA pseudouridine1911/1915/1917 synthase
LLFHLQPAADFSSLSPVRPGIVHRLDRGTSGCLVVAKNRKTLELLSSQFKNREVEKQYEAIVWGKMKDEGVFRSSIGRHPQDRKRMSTRALEGREAETRWKNLYSSSHFTWVRLFPKTGRTHQLRVHLSEGGFPIVGDPLYGKRSRLIKHLSPTVQEALSGVKATFLHAGRLSFRHPTEGSQLVFEAPLPKAFADMIALLKKES